VLTIYKRSNGSLAPQEDAVAGSWICATAPDDAEQSNLRALGVPASFIISSLDPDERSRTDRENGAILIIIRVPYDCGPNTDVRFRTVPLGLVLIGDLIITICGFKVRVLDSLLRSSTRVVSTVKRNRFVLHVLLATAQSYLHDLRQINGAVEDVEVRVGRSLQNAEVLELLAYQKSLVYFTTGLKTNELLMQRLQRSQLFQMYPDDQDLLEDVLTENTQAAEMTAISSNILSQMMNAYSSIIANNLNGVMKFLASATIVLSFPTIVASIYGMNVPLPGQEAPWAFYAVMATAVTISISVAVIFWRRDWF
jgi:magnesium transporter